MQAYSGQEGRSNEEQSVERVPRRSRRGLYLMASTSAMALVLSALPVNLEFCTDDAILELQMSSAWGEKGSGEGGEGGGGEGGGGEGGSGGESGSGGEGGGGEGSENWDESRDFRFKEDQSGLSRILSRIEQAGPDLNREEEEEAISRGWQ